MNTSVRVTGDPKTGNVVNVSGNDAFGYIRVEQERAEFDEVSGFVRIKKQSALVQGTVKDLLRLGWKDGQELPGKVVFKEQMVPFSKKDPERDLKVAGETEVVCKVNDDPIYRRTYYNPREDAQDVPVAHDNVEEIKMAYAEMQEEEKPDEFKL